MFIQLGFAERGHAFGAFDPGGNEAGGAEDFKMMGTGGLGNVQVHFIAGQRPSLGLQQSLDDGHPAGIGQGLHDVGQRHVAQGRMGIMFH